jgi:hypothetical protein
MCVNHLLPTSFQPLVSMMRIILTLDTHSATKVRRRSQTPMLVTLSKKIWTGSSLLKIIVLI